MPPADRRKRSKPAPVPLSEAWFEALFAEWKKPPHRRKQTQAQRDWVEATAVEYEKPRRQRNLTQKQRDFLAIELRKSRKEEEIARRAGHPSFEWSDGKLWRVWY